VEEVLVQVRVVREQLDKEMQEVLEHLVAHRMLVLVVEVRAQLVHLQIRVLAAQEQFQQLQDHQ